MAKQFSLKEWREKGATLLQKNALPSDMIAVIDIKSLDLHDAKVLKRLQDSFYKNPSLWCYHHPDFNFEILSTLRYFNPDIYQELHKNDLLSPSLREFLITNSNVDALMRVDPQLLETDTIPSFEESGLSPIDFVKRYKMHLTKHADALLIAWESAFNDIKTRKEATEELANLVKVDTGLVDVWLSNHLDIFHDILSNVSVKYLKHLKDVAIANKHMHVQVLALSGEYNIFDNTCQKRILTLIKKLNINPSTVHASSVLSYLGGAKEQKERFIPFMIQYFRTRASYSDDWIRLLEKDFPIITSLLDCKDMTDMSYSEREDYCKKHLSDIITLFHKGKKITTEEIELNF